ncbi:hypothetical protein U1763_09910 [Sphingomonas sp. LB2R24]|jgi:hypothetical protein|uniref:hypothetical protein n=1 Tax=Sphingomonas TaxID=13687 RepID=UPI002FCB63CD
MTAIAPPAFIINETSRFVTPARTTRIEQDRVLDTPQTVAASPWRAPLFYLSFVAAALLLVAVAIILAWRMISGLRRG